MQDKATAHKRRMDYAIGLLLEAKRRAERELIDDAKGIQVEFEGVKPIRLVFEEEEDVEEEEAAPTIPVKDPKLTESVKAMCACADKKTGQHHLCVASRKSNLHSPNPPPHLHHRQR